MVMSRYWMFCTKPPRSVSDFMRMPLVVLLNVQLLTSRSCTPPDVMLPIDTPCPAPNVQFETVMSAARALPPISILSSPSLMKELRISTLVEAMSIPSVLGESHGVLMVIPWMVIPALLPFNMRWNVGGFCRVTFWTRMRVDPLKPMKFGLDDARGNHQLVPWPSMVPGPLISTSWMELPEMNVVVPGQ